MKQVYRSNKKKMCLALRPWSAGHWQSSGYAAWFKKYVYVNYIGGSRSFDKF